MSRIVLILVAVLALGCGLGQAGAEERRVALVVGVSAYRNVPHLPNTANDARAMAAALQRLGFAVETQIDPDRPTLEAAVRRIGERAQGADAVLFYFAGHAIEASGRNWLFPASAAPKEARNLRFEALDIESVVEQTEGLARVTLLFLDACRDNPFRKFLGTGTREIPQSGLGQVRAAAGTLVAFSTAPGTVAADGKGPHSPFAGALLKHMDTPGLEIRQLLATVRREVREATRGRQVPWENSALEGEFFFRPHAPALAAPATPATPKAPAATAPVMQPGTTTDLDALFWRSIQDSRDPADLNAYLNRFPAGIFVDIARNRLAQLKAQADQASATPREVAPDDWAKALRARFDFLLPALPAQDREERVNDYRQASQHKTQAIALRKAGLWRSSGRSSADHAREAALEGCQIYFDEPCALVAVNTRVEPIPGDGNWTRHGMARVRYAGPFGPDHIPSISTLTRQRPDVAGYREQAGPKAAALHPWGRIFISTGAADQRAAEEASLAACNADPDRKGANGPCYLYAAGNDVVLGRRSREPLAAKSAVVAATVGQGAGSNTATADATAQDRTLVTVLAKAGFRTSGAEDYARRRAPKAFAFHVESGRWFFWSTAASLTAAETFALEGCQLRYGTPCALIASNDSVRVSDIRQAPRQDMPGLRYDGAFAIDRLPTFASMHQQVLRDYAAAPEPKALALHSGSARAHWAPGATVAEAEAKALAACRDSDPAMPCFILAVNGRVVLPQRRTEPGR